MQDRPDRQPRPRKSFYRHPLLTVLLVSLAYMLGQWVRLPGLDGDAVRAQLAHTIGPSGRERYSVVALGMMPLFGILLIFEILKLAVPKLAFREAGSRYAAARFALILYILALCMAALQALPLLNAFEVGGLRAADSDAFHLVGAASLVAGFAILIWLSGFICLPALAQAGFWAMLLIPSVQALVYDVGNAFGYMRTGAVSVESIAFGAVLLLLGVTAVVFTATAMRDKVAEAGGRPMIWSPILIWPPFIAGYLADFIAMIVQEFQARDGFPTLQGFQTAWIVCMVILIPVILLLYVRMLARIEPDSANWAGKRPLILAIAATQMAICVGVQLQTWPFVPIGGASLIALVIVIWAFVDAMRERSDRDGSPRSA